MAEKSQGPIGLVVRLPFGSPEEFLARYGPNLTRGGIYLRGKTVKQPGTQVTLDLKLANSERLIYAGAVVAFVTGQKGDGVSGMGIKFLTLDERSRRFLEKSLASPAPGQSTEPPLPQGVGPAQFQPDPEPKPAPRPNSASPTSSSTSTKNSGPIIGIDLGTTNSCAAFVRNGKPVVLHSREGHNAVPSVVALNARGDLVIGHPAKGQMLTSPERTVYGAKRLIGRAYDSATVQHLKDRFHYKITSGPSGESAVRLGDKVYSLQQISSMILREVKEVAQNQLGQEILRAVITVPAYYNDNQRQAVREAGKLAGLSVERILNEPTAAALAYGFGRKLKQRVLVYDLGGGTFDASVLELSDTVYEVISTGGETFLGGIDFDNAIVAYLVKQFESKTGRPFQNAPEAMQRIFDAAERAKCALSERSEIRIHLPFVTMIDDKPQDLDVTLTREKLEGLTEKLIDRTIAVCGEVLRAKNLSIKDIDEVILVGGQSRSPMVHAKIQAFLHKPPSKAVHPDEAVALGAALLASSLGTSEGLVLIDVLPMAIGIGFPNGEFQVVLERNTPLPSIKSHQLLTSHDNQTELGINLFQGDSANAAENEYLGTLKLSHLPLAPKGAIALDMTFDLSSECLLKVTARDAKTGREVASTFTTREPPKFETAHAAHVPDGAAVAATAQGGLKSWFRRVFKGA